MAFINQFPYSDFHEMNLDWIIKTIKQLDSKMDTFEALNQVTYKGQWVITEQYTKWSIVTNNNASYLSKDIVPAGIDITNENYWIYIGIITVDNELDINSINPVSNHAVTEKFNSNDSSIANLQDITELTSSTLDNEITNRINAETSINQNIEDVADSVTAETNARIAADNTINARIDNIATLPEGSTTADAELMDIRVALGGSIYDSAGNSVRGQIDNNRNLATAINEAAYGEGEEYKISGYNASNAYTTINDRSPFIYKSTNNVENNILNSLITGLTLDVYTAGDLDLGIVKLSDIVPNAAYDSTKFIKKTTISTTNTGLQTIFLNKPIFVPSGYTLFLGLPTLDNTLVFKYGAYGDDKGFYYISSGKYVFSSSSLGVDVLGIKINEIYNSTYNGKTLSILGDSISTFTGYIPSGNASYYPAGDVTDVSDTYWYKLMQALGMTLNVNNSWSGSYVTTNAGESSAGCMSRSQQLGTTPDVIIIYMGINDFNNEVELGTYNGKTALPSDTTTFREAYAIMLNKVLTAYPTSEVWCCTLPQCERNNPGGSFPEINENGDALADFNNAIIELANAFGVRVLDHNKSGLTYQNMSIYNPNTLHPNKYGHSLLANNDIWQMDNFIRQRYPIS